MIGTKACLVRIYLGICTVRDDSWNCSINIGGCAKQSTYLVTFLLMSVEVLYSNLGLLVDGYKWT